jgi:zinc protease
MVAKLLAALLIAAAAPSSPSFLHAQDAPGPVDSQAAGQKRGTGQVPAGITLAPQMPAPGSPRPYQFPKPITKTLPNGLRVFVIPGGKEPSVTVRLVLTTAGTAQDPQGKTGLAQLAATLLTDGTARRSAQQIAEAIDFVGGSLTANADDDGTYATAVVVKKDFDLAMDLLSDIVLHAAFQKEELDRRREQLLSNFEVEYADGNYLASAVFSRMVYGQHPYGLPEEGTPVSIRKITREDLLQFRDEHYVPTGALIAFAGDITPQAAYQAAEKYFGSWEKKDLASPSWPPIPAATGLRIFVVDKPDAVQTQIRVGRQGIPRNHPDYLPLYVTNRIFGGGFNSRLSTKVRQEKGLTYGAYSQIDSHKVAGSFLASTSTRTETTAEATRLVVDLIAEMRAGNVTPQELSFARDYLVGVFPIQSETPSQVAGRILNVAQYELPADYYDTYRDRILAFGPDQAKAMTQRYFDAANLYIVLMGNAKAFRDSLAKVFPGVKIEEISAAELDLLSPALRASAAGSVPAATPQSLAQGHDLFLAAAQAAGGPAIAKVESIEVLSKGLLSLSTGDLATEVRMQIAYPNSLRVDSKLPAGSMTQGFDGNAGWVSSAQGTQRVPPAFNPEFARGVALSGGIGVYRLILAGQLDAQLLGEEDVQGKKLIALGWAAPFGQVKLYVDPSTHLITAARYAANTPQGAADTLQLWNDFRAVDGIQYPFHTLTFRNGTRYNEITVDEVKLNTKPDPTVFSVPQ